MIGWLDTPKDKERVRGLLTIKGWVLKDSGGPIDLELHLGGSIYRPHVVWNPRKDVIDEHSNFKKELNPTPGYVTLINSWLFPDGYHLLNCVAKGSGGDQFVMSVEIQVDNALSEEEKLSREFDRADLIFFLHIPKTAGTTFRSILDSQFQYDEIAQFDYSDLVKHKEQLDITSKEDFDKLRIMSNHHGYQICELLPKKPNVVTMLRNPIQRVISYYQHLLRDTDKDDNPVISRNLQLKDFATVGDAINWQTRQIAGIHDDSRRNDVEVLEIAKENLKNFAFLGLVESFTLSIHLLSFTFDWPPFRQFDSLEVAPVSFDYESIPRETIEAIKEVNLLDLELYKYAERLFNSRVNAMILELFNHEKEMRDTS